MKRFKLYSIHQAGPCGFVYAMSSEIVLTERPSWKRSLLLFSPPIKNSDNRHYRSNRQTRDRVGHAQMQVHSHSPPPSSKDRSEERLARNRMAPRRGWRYNEIGTMLEYLTCPLDQSILPRKRRNLDVSFAYFWRKKFRMGVAAHQYLMEIQECGQECGQLYCIA